MRPSGRAPDELREIVLEIGASRHAEGSCLTKFGHTHVLCTASVEERVPYFLRRSGTGWVTAEYGMLPRATNTRTERESTRGRQTGRTQEIQRLLGRSLRAVTDLSAFGERQVRLDCDVLQADGGTRTAAITGACVALHLAFKHMVAAGTIERSPMTDLVSAVSTGLYNGNVILDLDYEEDSNAQADANFVLTSSGSLVEVQGTAEKSPFSRDQFMQLLDLACDGAERLGAVQRKALALV